MADIPEDANAQTSKESPKAAEPAVDSSSLLAQGHFHPDKVQWSWKGGSFSVKAFRTKKLMAILLFAVCLICACRYYLPCGKESVWHWFFWLIFPVGLYLWYTIQALILSKTIRYSLCDDNLICKKGLLRQKTENLLIPQMSDVRMRQSLWDRLINGGVGTIIIYVAGDLSKSTEGKQISGHHASTFVMSGLENPREVFDSLEKIRAAYASKRGLVGFDGGAVDDMIDGNSDSI